MRIVMVVALYMLGMVVYILWMFSDKEEMKKGFIDPALSNPDIARLPRSVIVTAACIILLVMGLFWPVSVITTPFQILKDKGQ